MRDAEVAQQVEQRTENPRVPSPILGLGTSPGGSSSVARMPPCQGGGREFESRLPLQFISGRSGGIGRRDGLKNHWGATLMSVRSRPSAVEANCRVV